MCARGFLVCSTWSDKSRAELCARHNTLKALFGLLKSGKETKMTVATKLTNLVVKRKVFPTGSETPGT